MAYFVGRKLPHTCQRKLLHGVGGLFTIFIRLQKTFRNKVILPVPVGAEGYHAFDDFTGPRIDIRGA
ncbi:hypothetical protein D3C86_1710910 [compost metagenome]